MKKQVLVLVLLAVVACVFIACGNQPKEKIVIMKGDWAQLKKYPLLKKGQPYSKMKGMGLTMAVVDYPTRALNHTGKGWRGPELIKAGTYVWIDKTGRPWYKADCNNRLFVPVDRKCPPTWKLPWGWTLPWWLPLIFLLLFLAMLIPWLPVLIVWALAMGRYRGGSKPWQRKREPDLHNGRGEHIPGSKSLESHSRLPPNGKI